MTNISDLEEKRTCQTPEEIQEVFTILGPVLVVQELQRRLSKQEAQLTTKDQEIERLNHELICYKESVVEGLKGDLTKLLQAIMAIKATAQHMNGSLPSAKGFSDAVIMFCDETLEDFPCSSKS